MTLVIVKSGKLPPRKLLKQSVAEPAVPIRKEPEAPPNLAEENETIKLFQNYGRPYRLSFGGLPRRKSLDKHVRSKLARELDMNEDAFSAQKQLLPTKHETLRLLSSARSSVENTFQALTLPYPWPGIRLFVFDPHTINVTGPVDEIDKELARQRTIFEESVNTQIKAYGDAVDKLVADWPDILQKSREQMPDQFNPADYPPIDDLRARLYVNFWAEGQLSAVAPETRYLSCEMQDRERDLNRQRFEEIVQLQERVMIDAFTESITELVDKVKAVDSGKASYFKSSAIEKVFEQFNEFNTKCLKYGILRGTGFEDELKRARRVLQADTVDPKRLKRDIDNSPTLRQTVVTQLSEVADVVTRIFSDGSRRRALHLE